MKKIYCRPEIKFVWCMPEKIMGTDTTGNLEYGRGFGARQNSFVDDEDEEEITNSVWFSD